jgi:hypothetical protein
MSEPGVLERVSAARIPRTAGSWGLEMEMAADMTLMKVEQSPRLL